MSLEELRHARDVFGGGIWVHHEMSAKTSVAVRCCRIESRSSACSRVSTSDRKSPIASLLETG